MTLARRARQLEGPRRAARWRGGAEPFVRPERARDWRAVAGTGRVHTASERGQWRPDGATSQKSRSFAIQPLSPWLSCELPTLISGGWSAGAPARGAGPAARPGALGGSPPPSGRSRGGAAPGTLTCLDGPRVFVSVTKGEGCSLTPARGGGGGRGHLGPLAGFRSGRAATGRPASCAPAALPRHPGASGGAAGHTCGSARAVLGRGEFWKRRERAVPLPLARVPASSPRPGSARLPLRPRPLRPRPLRHGPRPRRHLRLRRSQPFSVLRAGSAFYALRVSAVSSPDLPFSVHFATRAVGKPEFRPPSGLRRAVTGPRGTGKGGPHASAGASFKGY